MGNPSYLKDIVLGTPTWVIFTWFQWIMVIFILLSLHFLILNPPHSAASHPTKPRYLIDSTMSQLIYHSLSCQQLLNSILALGWGQLPVHTPIRLVILPILYFIRPLHIHLHIVHGIVWSDRSVRSGYSVCAGDIVWCGQCRGSICGGIRRLGIVLFVPYSSAPFTLYITLHFFYILLSATNLIVGAIFERQHANESWVREKTEMAKFFPTSEKKRSHQL